MRPAGDAFFDRGLSCHCHCTSTSQYGCGTPLREMLAHRKNSRIFMTDPLPDVKEDLARRYQGEVNLMRIVD
jgi:predicted ATPase